MENPKQNTIKTSFVGTQSVSAELIVRRRASALQLQSRSPQAKQSARSYKSTIKVQAAIDHVREQFWQLPVDELNSRLAGIDITAFPELATAVEALKRAAAAREDFPKLALVLKSNLLLWDHLKRSITANPRDVAGLKELVFRDIMQNGKARRYKRVARLIKSDYPRIHAIDPAWIDEILTIKAPGLLQFSLPTINLPIPGWMIGVILYTVIKGCAAIHR